MQEVKRYEMRLIGHDRRILGVRYVLTMQAIGRVAAVSLPMAEARRLFGETGGATSTVLKPMEEALREQGYDTLMLLPAHTKVVELVEVPATGPDSTAHDAHRAEQHRTTIALRAAAEALAAALQHLTAHPTPGDERVKALVQGALGVVTDEYVSKG